MKWSIFSEVEGILVEMGGPGSGHHGHAGRKGKRGGSARSMGAKRGVVGGLSISSFQDYSVFHGTVSNEIASKIENEGLRPGASVGMSGQAPEGLPFVYITPSRRVAQWYAENNVRGRGRVVKGKFTGRVVDDTAKPTTEFGAMVHLAERLGQKIGPDRIVDMHDLANKMRDRDISAIAFRDLFANNRLSWVTLPESIDFKRK